MDPLDRELIVLTYHHVAVPPRGTPIRGLYLCGSGSHPGGGLTGGPGTLAAAAILKEWHG